MGAAAWGANDVAWSGDGRFRILVHVPPVPGTTGTGNDEMVAVCQLVLEKWLSALGIEGSVDLSTFQVHQYDSQSGRPQSGVPFESATSLFDRPCRFEDDQYRNSLPSRVGRASETSDGRAALVKRRRKARLFNREHRTDHGRMVWSHSQSGNATSHYAIYFDVVPTEENWGIPSSPWIGDGNPLRQEHGQPLGGFSHFTASAGDINGDGLFDIVAGNEKGDVFWYPNRGHATNPKFVGCHLIEDEIGPIDTGWYAAPVVHDWDSDGLEDLLVGTSGNVILWWRNIGKDHRPQFQYAGFVQANGKRLEVPEQPVDEDPTGVFARDYFNQPWVGDLDDDGHTDLVTGGYTTGRIFCYRSDRRNSDGTPELHFAGELQDTKGPIDTIWGAAPALYDVNYDGRKDLVTGAWWWSGIHRKPNAGETDLLWYFRGSDDGNFDHFTREVFPAEGSFPAGSIARPAFVDANGDGLVDLLVSESGGNAHIFLNAGSRTEPRWDLRSAPLTAPWGFSREFDVSSSTADINADGSVEILVGNEINSLLGSPASPNRKLLGRAHVDGKPIDHPGPGYGDPYSFSILYDWDRDGYADILWGDQQGNVYLHRSIASPDPLAFAAGVRLRLVGGAPLRVGPPVVDSADDAADFTILQGSRVVLNVADFDGDGIDDLLVGDTFANLWVFRGTRPAATDAFLAGELLIRLPTRPESIACTDWNNDGLVDLLVGGTAEKPGLVFYNSSEPGRPHVESGKSLGDLPYLFWGPKLRADDWNGDGDVDLLVQSEFFSFWLERSFLEHGYRMATVRHTSVGSPIVEKPTSIERFP